MYNVAIVQPIQFVFILLVPISQWRVDCDAKTDQRELKCFFFLSFQ